jgi:uncharacterized membrane protein
MTRTTRSVCLLALAAAAGLSVPTAAARTARYRMTDLSAAAGGLVPAMPLGLNRDGVVAGMVEGEGGHRPVIWRNGTMVTPELPEGTIEGFARSVNSAGKVVGTTYSREGFFVRNRACVFRGATRKLPPPEGFDQAEGFAINDHGQIAGAVTAESGRFPAVWRKAADGSYGWSVLPEFPNAFAARIGKDGTLLITGLDAAALWKEGLTTPITPPEGYFAVQLSDLNDSGEVAGTVFRRVHFDSFPAPFIWQHGEVTVLPLPEGAVEGSALGLTSRGAVVGFVSGKYGQDPRPILWERRRRAWQIVDLAAAGASTAEVTMQTALDLNARGQIIGTGIGADGVPHALLLTPRAGR